MGIFTFGCIKSESAITYSFSGGRFGDNLVAYSHARWIAYTTNTPFIYRPFTYSDALKMHQINNVLTKKNKFKKKITYPQYPKTGEKVKSLEIKADNNLYVIPYFPECLEELCQLRLWHFDVNWKDEHFLNLLRSEITPIEPLDLIKPAAGQLSLAVHVRRGGSYDVLFQSIKRSRPTVDQRTPLKFPPDSFYIESIKNAYHYLGRQPLYVHIFTDDPDPEALVNYYRQEIPIQDLTFGCRQKNNAHDRNVLEDFFSLTQFDALIRPQSNFSIMASKLGRFKLIISPKDYVWEETTLVITDTYIETYP